MALRWSDVDLATGIITVRQSHDPESRTTGTPKSAAGHRRVPMPPVLREHLVAHKMRAKPTQPLIFARSTLAGRRRTLDGGVRRAPAVFLDAEATTDSATGEPDHRLLEPHTAD